MNIKKLAFCFCVLSWALWVLPARAQLVLSPTRVVFEGPMRSTQMDVINTTGQRAIYRLSLVNRRMTETGENVPAEAPQLAGERFLNDMVRFTPRQLVLEPGASQVVRLSLRKPPGLEPGEYRSHLHIERVADASDATSLESATGSAAVQDMQIRLTALVGAMVPVIVREGQPTAHLTLHDLQILPGGKPEESILSLALKRQGDRSVYGDVVISRVQGAGNQAVEIARLSGIAVYVPNEVLKLRVSLPALPGGPSAAGTLRVAFQLKSEEGARALAEAEVAMR